MFRTDACGLGTVTDTCDSTPPLIIVIDLRIVAGTGVACRNAEEGERRAEKAMAAGSVIGAHVVRVMADEEAGDYGEPEYLASYGVVPATE